MMRRVLVGLMAALALLAAPAAEPTLTPAEHRRGAEQTFLTYPEWFLVHSPAELATYLTARKTPSDFPWLGHVGQFWQGYRAVTRETADQPFNAGYHLMVMVIGTSTTVEYVLRSAYESTVGRLSEFSARGAAASEEDALAARVAQQYVDFIRVDPWYLFDFVAALRDLWQATPLMGPQIVRKWERRYLLTTEYTIKAGYAWLIKFATGTIYHPARPVTAVVLSAPPAAKSLGLPEVRRIEEANPTLLYTVPRYRPFMAYAELLASQGLDFVEIAGNRGEILVSVIQRSGAAPAASMPRLVLLQPVLSQPGWERRLFALPVPKLAEQLRHWRAAGMQIEHIYDY